MSNWDQTLDKYSNLPKVDQKSNGKKFNTRSQSQANGLHAVNFDQSRRELQNDRVVNIFQKQRHDFLLNNLML